MSQQIAKFSCIIFSIMLTLGLSGCASSPEQAATDTEAPAATGESAAATEAAPAASDAAPAGDAAPAQVEASAPATETAADQQMAAAAPAAEQAMAKQANVVAEAPKVVESCKKEPYMKYEKAARESIKKGWDATKAERFGVGFRNADEHKKWSSTHNTLFKNVSNACEDLAKCARANKKDKQKKCATQAAKFSDWQALGKVFAAKVKEVESTQVDKLCSLKPNLDDPRRCFMQLSENVRKSCKSDACIETADCWQGMAFMDDALRQAETSCRFARTKLAKCRGYTEQMTRRKNKLGRCAAMQEKLNVPIMPVI